MDAKVTLSFNKSVINKAKSYAEAHNMSLSRMLEVILSKLTSGHYQSIEELPLADWVNQVSEGNAVYSAKPKSRKALKQQFHSRKK